MKKFLKNSVIAIIIALMVILLIPASYAVDCFRDPVYDRDWNAEVTTGAFVRDVACMEGSVILTTLPVGEVVHVTAETDGWYKIERNDGTFGWVGQWLISPTSKSFVMNVSQPEEPKEPMHDISGHIYEDAIWYIYENGIVDGYPDGSYKPNTTINRAELLKIIVEAVYENDEFNSYQNENCFSDVPPGEWFTNYVCFGKAMGIVEGYGDGTFRPAREINFVEALKIAMNTFGYDYEETDPWYKGFVDTASKNNFIPLDVDYFGEQYSRGQMAEMITRILKFENGTLNEYLGDDSDERVAYDELM
ncbi:SH3 domain-containing protein [Candidatus Peregrinibacteria bacterium]|nr:SH3 domain-containing protein [Candidatus Peregrinibacteria bacterium]